MVADNTNSKGSSAGKEASSRSSSGSSNTNSKGSTSSAGKNSSSAGSGFGGSNSPAGMGSSRSSPSSGNTNSKGGSAAGSNSGASNGGSGFGGANSPAGMNNSGVGGGMAGGLNSSGNRASGAGPGASGNTSTTGGGFGGTPTGSSPGFGGANSPRGVDSTLNGGMVSDAARRADMAQAARASENASMKTFDAAKAISDANSARADLAQQARAAETKSVKDLAREKALGIIAKAEAGTKDPYSLLSGGKVTADLANMTVKDAVSFSKTKWNGKLENVIGAFGFKDTTLLGIATKMGLLDAKMTPQVQDQLAVGLLQERANRATVNGQVDVDKFARELSKEWASVADPTTGVSHWAANGIDKASVSVATARDIARDLVSNGVVSPGKSVSNITSKDVSSVQTQTPGVSRFSATFMGGKPASTTATPKGTSTQQNDPSGLPNGDYQGFDPSGLPPDKPVGGMAPAVSKPSAAAPAPTAERPRSTAEKVAAGAIDIGLGMLPGIGMGVGLVNGGLALTGNKTLGENIVGSFVDGKGGAGPDSGARSGGYLPPENSNYSGTIVKDTSTVPKAAASFEERYLAFVDPTSRPKPSEKWNYDTADYS